jgi:diguanylate cyclase (GGDEF)-like protein/PAS domain S-box-containing protein
MNELGFRPWDGDPAQAVAIARVLRRVGGAAGVHIYELEAHPDGSYRCTVWIGEAVESLLGPIPPGMDPEAAWEACVHPDDRAAYDEVFARQYAGQSTELEYRMCGFDGRVRWLWERCRPRRADDGRLLVDGIVNDITERRRMQELLQAAADHDQLTGLPNRSWFQRRLEAAVVAAREAGSSIAVLFVDLDGFKAVNDRWGHAAGDDVLVAVGRRLQAEAGSAVAARLGGDEFLLLTEPREMVADAERAAVQLASRLHDALAAPLRLAGATHVIGASIGIAVLGRDADTVEGMIRSADASMYRVKRSSRQAA